MTRTKKEAAPVKSGPQNLLPAASITHDTVDWTLVKRVRESTTTHNPFDEKLCRAARFTLPASGLDVSEKFFGDVAA